MKKWLYCILVSLFNIALLHGQEGSRNDIDNMGLLKNERRNSHFTTHILNDQGLSYFMEHLADDVHVHLPVEGGWGEVLPYTHSFNGASYKWTKHFLDGVRINNALIPGDAMFHLGFDAHTIEVNPYTSGILLNTLKDSSHVLSLSGLVGNIGSRVGWADWFINNISGHNSAQQRAVTDIGERMHVPFQIKIKYKKANPPGDNEFYLQFIGGERRHIDQDYLGRSNSYSEKFHQVTFTGSLNEKIQYAGAWQYRSHVFSEFQYDLQETASRDLFNLSIFKKGKQSYGVHMNVIDLSYRDASFNRNVIDQDGEGLQPYYQDGSQFALTPFYDLKGAMTDERKWNYELALYNSWIRHSPQTVVRSNGIYYQSDDANYRSLHVIDWEMDGHSNWLIDNQARITYEDQDGRTRVQLAGGIHLIGMTYNDSALFHLRPSIDIGLEQDLSEAFIIGLRLGWIPRAYDIDQARLLTSKHMNGMAFYWDDVNKNRLVEDSERGSLLYTTGGRFRSRSEDLGPSTTYYIDVPIQFTSSGDWKFRLIPQFRSHRNTWDVQYHPDLPLPVERIDSGSWIYKRDRQVTYEVIPYSEEWMRDSEGKLRSVLFNQPFYAGITFQFEKESKSFYVRGSGTGHIVAGGATMGNGPIDNNINQSTDAMADLNLRHAFLGRIDSDRSYLANLLVGYKYSDKGKISFQLRYRDGQSFGYYESHLHENTDGTQVAFSQPLPRGDDPFTRLMGRREDFLMNINVSLQHVIEIASGNLNLRIHAFNLFDFGTEVSEFTYGDEGEFLRAPLELQVPRTISISLQYLW